MILCTSLVLGSVLPAYAAGTGTLTIRPKVGDDIQSASVYNGTFKVYRVADYAETGVFTFTNDFKDAGISLDNLFDSKGYREIGDALADYQSKNSKITAILSGVKVDETNSLSYGLYLIRQDSSADGYNDCTPFLAMIPEYSENATNADVVAYPKVSKVETLPPVTPPDNPPPDNPPDNPPPTTPPETPPDTPEDEGGEETPPTPGEDIGNMDDSGNMNENGEINEVGGLTGDNSQMVAYGAIAGAAVVILGGWLVWKRKKDKTT